MMLARRLQAHDHQSWSLNVEPGDRQETPDVSTVSVFVLMSYGLYEFGSLKLYPLMVQL